METADEVKQLISDVNDATNLVATRLGTLETEVTDLSAQIAAGTPVTQEQLDGFGASLSAVKDRLTALGADPSNPVPPAV